MASERHVPDLRFSLEHRNIRCTHRRRSRDSGGSAARCRPRGEAGQPAVGGKDVVVMNWTRTLVLVAHWAAVAMVVTAGTAHADPTPAPTPSPGYQVITPGGPVFPGMQQYQPTCLVAPLACNLRYHPDTGTWQPGGDQ